MAPFPAASAPPSSSVATFNSPISEKAYIICQSVLLALAISNTIWRTYVRLKKFKKLFYDDAFLFVALAAVITSTAFGFWNYTVSKNLSTMQAAELSLKSIMYSISGDILLWLAIYCVKFSFMVYFRGLIRMQPAMIKWWWIVLSIIIPCAIGTVFCAFWVCPTGIPVKMVQCISAPTFIHGEFVTVYFSVFADILTDLLLLSIPVSVLAQLQVSGYQKCVIGLVLCCSVFMIAIAILRGVATYIRGTSDQVWTLFWINTQANVAIIMVCFTAWRTFYLERSQTEAALRRRNNVQNLNHVQGLPRRTCWPWKKAEESVHAKQLREAREAQEAQQAQNSTPWNSNDPTENASRNTNTSGQAPSIQPQQMPRAFLPMNMQGQDMEMSELRSDLDVFPMGVPELRRISRLQPGDRVLVFSSRMGAMSTESFV
ncbi:hypothetical protein MMC26_004701 [Xylographa opegraphella]|nr:hypothetical protein [Xylographa opegraphella]